MSTPPEDPYAHLFRDPEPAREASPEPRDELIAEPEWLAASDSDEIFAEEIAVEDVAVVDHDPAVDEIAVVAQVVDHVDVEQVDFEPVDIEPAVAPSAPVVAAESPRTGRLFRSAGSSADTEALLAVPAHQASKLRTLKQGEPAPAAPLVIGAPAEVVEVRPAAREDDRRIDSRRAESRHAERTDEARGRRAGSLTAIGTYVIVTAVTVILGFGSALIFGQAMGVLSGIGLIATSVFSALAIRRGDDINAIFAPPIAYFITIITAGQIGVNVSSFSGRLVEIFFLMGTNWIWLAAAVLAALIIVALRRRTN